MMVALALVNVVLVGVLAVVPAARSHQETETPMIATIFEVEPAEGRKDTYLDLAARLLPTLEAIDGFNSVERFQSLTSSGKILSLSFFRDEAAVMA